MLNKYYNDLDKYLNDLSAFCTLIVDLGTPKPLSFLGNLIILLDMLGNNLFR
jgi:hypothetical protein